MINSKTWLKAGLFLFLLSSFLFAAKEIYIPKSFKNFDSPSSQWSSTRMDSTENWIILWEAGFGSDPSLAPAPYKVDMAQLKAVVENSFDMNLNTLKMVTKGSSNTDKYKMILVIVYDTEWGAYGSGFDDVIGSLQVNPAAANIGTVVAHEIGHTFQYQTACDVKLGGFRYGLGPNGEGGNGFWEQGAQWAAYNVYPSARFTGDFNTYINSNHLHILHETPRYANYFLPDYWAYKRGIDFMGYLWRDSRRPEDPVDAYKRIFKVSQKEFNDEIYEHAARLTTWDLPAIKALGANHINKRPQVKMNKANDNFWIVDRSVAIENYGYNSIKLNAPKTESVVSVQFQGKAGASGYRVLNIDKGGWRYGFVALLSNGTRVYSDMASLNYTGQNPEGALSFTVPAACSNLWLIVSGAPQEHWHHTWDDDDTNDEQWPYQVKFSNTNLLGEANGSDDPYIPPTVTTVQLAYNVVMAPKSNYEPVAVPLKAASIASAFGLTESELGSKIGKEIAYYGVNPDGSFNATSTAVDPGHWYNKDGQTIAYGNDARIYSEIDVTALTAKIGQYPSLSANGDIYTIRQALVYQKSPTEKVQVHLTFSVSIEGTSKIKQWVNRPILHQGELPILSSETQQLLSEGHATLGVYNTQGKKMASAQNVSSWEDLGITKNGVYRIVLFENNKIKATQSISYIAGRR